MNDAQSEVTFTLREAASVCGVSLSTIRRRHESGTFPGAAKTDDGTWRVPLPDLLAAGFQVSVPGQAQPEQPPPARERISRQEIERIYDERVRELEQEKHRLQIELLEERAERMVAQALARERQQWLEDYRRRELAAGPSTPEPPAEPEKPAPSEPRRALDLEPEPVPQRRGLLNRIGLSRRKL